jgi:hypothetical protein
MAFASSVFPTVTSAAAPMAICLAIVPAQAAHRPAAAAISTMHARIQMEMIYVMRRKEEKNRREFLE